MSSKILLLLIISILLTLSISDYSYSVLQNSQEVLPSQASYAPGEFIIKLKNIPPKVNKGAKGTIETGLPSIDALNSKFNVNSMEKILEKHQKLAEKSNKLNLFKQHGLDRIYLLKLPKDTDITKAVNDFKRDVNIEYAEPNYIYSIDLMPNDPSFSLLYGLHNTGQSGGVVDADIDAVEAWDIKKDSNNIVISVIDTGIDYNHPELAANIWANLGEIPSNNIDDDNNGFIDDVHGFDFVNNDNDPMDDNSHGTHVTGTIAAVGNNGIGITGVNWQAKIMALKFLNSAGSGTTANAVKSVQYASLMGAKITSNSWGGGSYSQALYDAIAAANSLGILFVAAAGNNNMNTDISPYYPQGYDIPNIVSVAATDHNDRRSIWSATKASNYGLLSVDIAAPGSSIYSTIPNNLYGYKSGTSMATPHVSGVFGLVFSKNPGLSIQEARSIVEDNTDYIATDQPIGGRLNAYNALFPRSKISNDGPPQIKGYLLLKSQVFSGGSWQDIGSSVNDLANNNLRIIEPADILNIRQLYNNLNFIPQQPGSYRIFARFTDINGNVITTNNGPLQDTFEFSVTTSTTSTSTSTTSIFTTSTIIPNATKSIFYAVSDSYVNESNPLLNYGGSSVLASEGGNSSRKRIYLKFNVSLVSPNVSKILVVAKSAGDPCNGDIVSNPCIEFYRVTDTSWSEYFINWNNKPNLDIRLTAFQNVDTGSNYAFGIHPSWIPRNGLYSFVLSSPNLDSTKWFSRESNYRPYMEVTYITSTTTSTSTSTSTSTTIPANVFNFTAIEDTYVRETAPSANFGTSAYLGARGNPGLREISYIKFMVSGLTKNITNAKLFLTNVALTDCNTNSPNKCINVFYIANNTWNQNRTAWINRPVFGALINSLEDLQSSNFRPSIDVTGSINGNGVYSLGLDSTANSTGILFYAREAQVSSSLKPILQIRQS